MISRDCVVPGDGGVAKTREDADTQPAQGMMGVGRVLVIALLALAACTPSPTPSPRYVLGQPYQAGGVWHYPREAYELTETGLAGVMPAPKAGLTTNGEAYDPAFLTAAHPTIQLPAIVKVTNLENGLATVVRVNDRGSGDPHRLILVSPRAAQLLRFNGPTRVRITVLPKESREATDSVPGAPALAIATAPRAAIEVADLAPPPGVAQGRQRGGTTAIGATVDALAPANLSGPARLPETLTQEAVYPGRLMVRLGLFEEYRYAALQRARVGSLRPEIVQVGNRRQRQFRVELGPFATVAQAEAAQDQALAAGVPDARIVVD